MSPVTLSDLPQILNELVALDKEQTAQIQFYKSKIDDLVEKHKTLATSPMSVQARLNDSLKILAHEWKTFLHNMQEDTAKSVRLYWLQQLFLYEFEVEKLDQEIEMQNERNHLYKLAKEKLYPLLPRLITPVTQEFQGSSGRLAVSLSQAQGETLRNAFKLIQLENREENLNSAQDKADVSLENAAAAALLSDFELNVMDWCLNQGKIFENERVSNGFGVGMITELDVTAEKLKSNVVALEDDVTQLREALAQAIDAQERNLPVSGELLRFANSILNKHESALENSSQPLPF